MRKFETRDIVERLGFIPPKNISIKGFEIDHPKAIFNGSIVLEDDKIVVYSRIVVGYYQYISGICRFKLDLDLKNLKDKKIVTDLYVLPDTKYDLFGCEDPRAQKINRKTVMTYTGRTINYFKSSFEKAVPIVCYESGEELIKRSMYIEKKFISCKNASFLKTTKNLYFLFRPEVKKGSFALCYSIVSEKDLFDGKNCEKYFINKYAEVLYPEKFEEKIGWGTPPVEVERDKYLVFVHGRGIDEVYRVFAVLISEENKKLVIKGVTPFYIMEPKTLYEKFGDRPFVVFPCGAIKIDDEIIISYGAADTFLGFGRVKVDELLDIIFNPRSKQELF